MCFVFCRRFVSALARATPLLRCWPPQAAEADASGGGGEVKLTPWDEPPDWWFRLEQLADNPNIRIHPSGFLLNRLGEKVDVHGRLLKARGVKGANSSRRAGNQGPPQYDRFRNQPTWGSGGWAATGGGGGQDTWAAPSGGVASSSWDANGGGAAKGDKGKGDKGKGDSKGAKGGGW